MNFMFTAAGFGERTAEALQDTLIGMFVIFLALGILWGVIELFHFFVTAATKKNKKAEEKPAEKVPAETVSAADTADDADNGALIAAITAAVSACIDAPAGSFRVVSFKKAQSDAHWNKR